MPLFIEISLWDIDNPRPFPFFLFVISGKNSLLAISLFTPTPSSIMLIIATSLCLIELIVKLLSTRVFISIKPFSVIASLAFFIIFNSD